MNRPRQLRVMLALLLIALLVSSFQPLPARAADGDLDPSFGAGGKVTTDFLRGGSDFATAVAVQKDGKIVVAGNNGGNFAVARYNADGSLDASFGDGGRVVTDFGGNSDGATAVAMQSDGKIVVAGVANPVASLLDFALARYNQDGSLDPTFGIGGRVTTDFNQVDRTLGVAIQPSDGKIIAVGSSNTFDAFSNFALARYNPDGSLDATFGNSGKVITDFGGGSDQALAVVLQADEKIIAAGYADTSSTRLDFALARYNADGSLDATFDGDGKVTTNLSDLSTEDQAFGVAIQPTDGKVIAAGFARNSGTGLDFALARYNVDGSLDTTFGNGGKVTTDVGSSFDRAFAIALQADNKIIATGSTGNGVSLFDFALARYNPDGSPDSKFGNGGRVITGFGNNDDEALAVGLQDDGRIVAAGVSSNSDRGLDFALARYNVDGSLDPTFDGDGKLITDWPNGSDSGAAIALQSDGKIIVVGENGGNFALARYNADGSLDATFGNGGRVTTDFGGIADRATAIALQADGKIVVAGSASRALPFSSSQVFDFVLARYNADGSLDASFDGDGKVMTDFSADDQAFGVTIQPADGKIVAAGVTTVGPGRANFALARYNADGSLDASFDGDGKVTTNPSNDIFGGGQANVVAIQSDGKIVAAGYASNTPTGRDFALARYNADGSLDTTFDGDGKVTTDLSNFFPDFDRFFHDEVAGIAIQPADGKIVAAGSASNPFAFALARYNPDGSLDTTFDGDGKVTTSFTGFSGEGARAVAIHSADGKIIAAGSVTNRATVDDGIILASDLALARYNPDGSLDLTFDGDGKVTTNLSRSNRDDGARAVAIQGDSKIVAAGFAISSDTNSDFALARYGDTADTTPPTVACPAGRQAVTTRPRDTCAVVAYPPPIVSDNLPGATVACAPPSGSCFPVGTTTVTCTATDAAGNTAACSFTVSVFDVLLQSDSDPNAELLINSFTGDYSFCCPGLPPGQSPLRGRGQVLYSGSTISLTHHATAGRLLATVSPSPGRGTATLKAASGQVLCPIQDRNIYDNLPLLCGNALP